MPANDTKGGHDLKQGSRLLAGTHPAHFQTITTGQQEKGGGVSPTPHRGIATKAQNKRYDETTIEFVFVYSRPSLLK